MDNVRYIYKTDFFTVGPSGDIQSIRFDRFDRSGNPAPLRTGDIVLRREELHHIVNDPTVKVEGLTVRSGGLKIFMDSNVKRFRCDASESITLAPLRDDCCLIILNEVRSQLHPDVTLGYNDCIVMYDRSECCTCLRQVNATSFLHAELIKTYSGKTLRAVKKFSKDSKRRYQVLDWDCVPYVSGRLPVVYETRFNKGLQWQKIVLGNAVRNL